MDAILQITLYFGVHTVFLFACMLLHDSISFPKIGLSHKSTKMPFLRKKCENAYFSIFFCVNFLLAFFTNANKQSSYKSVT